MLDDVSPSSFAFAKLLPEENLRRSSTTGAPDGFVPPKPIHELRDLMGYRRKLVETQRNHLLKGNGYRQHQSWTNVFGMSGRLMLRALIEGKATPQEMAELAKVLLRKKIPELQLALERSWERHRFLLELQLQQLEAGGQRPGGSGTTHP